MNLTTILLAALTWAASIGGAFWYGIEVGDDHATAAVAREERIGRVAAAAATNAAAFAIAGIKVKNVYTRQELEREVRTNTVFAECRSGDAAVRMLNATAADATAASAAGGGQLSASGAAR